MYTNYWQLESKPFENTSDARFYFPSECHQGALFKLRYVVESRGEAAVLAGPSGTGKTLVVRALTGQLGETARPVMHLVFPQLPPDQLLAVLASELTGEPPSRATQAENLQAIERCLRENAAAGRHAVLIVDESQLLHETGALETLRLLLNFEQDSRPTLTVIFVGHPSLLVALEQTPQLDQRMQVKCLLRRYSSDETAQYVHHRLSAAGARRAIFSDDALLAIHNRSQGSARGINRLCDLALLVSFAEERSVITASQIESVAQELVTVSYSG